MMEGEPTHPNVFNLLSKPMRNALIELGFSEPTAPQAEAIPTILDGGSVLLIAPTGSGKTEAVLLPIFSNFIQQPDKRGISILYITPLRALNRDLVRRLSYWALNLGISIEVRHGDTEIKIRRRQALRPPNMLVTTPETLQAILPGSRMQRHLSHVRYVIVDEVHELAADKRGAQLTIALERLFEVVGREFQRVGLSATVGNPQKAAKFVAGTHRHIKVIEVPLPKGYQYMVEHPIPEDPDYDLAQKLRTAPEAAARIRRISDLVKRHTSTLIFVNSRTNAEMLGHKFNQLTSDIAVHHGSLSKEERALIEDEFKAKALKAIVCTSTLELGIDIGHVDLVIQYLSPRQASSLIQRVGRSGHKLDLISKGVIITAFPDDTLEAVSTVRNAYKSRLEPLLIHENALDVLAHQVAGILLDKRRTTVNQVLEILHRAYPYRNLSKAKLLDVAGYLHKLRELRMEGDTLKKTLRTRPYYYENLSMIPDERRYPIVDILSDRAIGTLGDEFMALRARVGLSFICRGKVWRIVQIEDETGTVYVVPSEDPMAAIPGWDGEILPVPLSLALEVGKLRAEIVKDLDKEKKPEVMAEKLAKRLSTDKSTLLKPIEEVHEHLKQGAPLPTHEHVVIEAFDKYIIIHACFGEVVNRTLGCVFDSILSDHELITGWWNDGYRVLIEMPRRAEPRDLEKLPSMLFRLTEVEVDKAFDDYLKARFPFSYKMKFVAERFGALPRGRTMGPERLAQLPQRFQKTPIYEETLREAMMEKVDIPSVKRVMMEVKEGKIKVSTIFRLEKPTPLAYHILAKYSEIPELMAPERVLLSNIERMKRVVLARKTSLLCVSCGSLSLEKRIRELPEKPTCEKCGSGLLAYLRLDQNPNKLRDILQRRLEGKGLVEEELEQLSHVRRTADLILSYGKRALIALQVKGVGPETAFRILGKMHPSEDDFYMDLLKAKIQYLRTRPYWENDRLQIGQKIGLGLWG
ncbi:MAG: putative ski2-type helicase [Candidatus Bathyarchaeota archaeon BA1]|nr:MAG: putative ski2-type helicase [Candidatus Bathyarchaeota archaeon BA1]